MKRTIKAPFTLADKTKTTIDITGQCYIFEIGNQKIKFIVHTRPQNNNDELFISHYASGLGLGSLTPVKLSHHRTGLRLTDRSAAELTILKLVDRVGVDRFLVKINSSEVINK